jgi:hypothetical protein
MVVFDPERVLIWPIEIRDEVPVYVRLIPRNTCNDVPVFIKDPHIYKNTSLDSVNSDKGGYASISLTDQNGAILKIAVRNVIPEQ